MGTFLSFSEFTERGRLLFAGFNQDRSAFAIGTDDGFFVFASDPPVFQFRNVNFRGVGFVEMLFRTNILALVGGGDNPRSPPDTVSLWDDHKKQSLFDLHFGIQVRSVRLRRDRLVVVLQNKINVYSVPEMELLVQFATSHNPRGICAISHPEKQPPFIAFPGVEVGTVEVARMDAGSEMPVIKLHAHDHPISAITLNFDGTRLATASDEGTLVRVWEVDPQAGTTKKDAIELRRGKDRAKILCLSFNYTSTHLMVSSDHDTAHIFALEGENRNKKASLAVLGYVSSYWASEWSMTAFHLPPMSVVDFSPSGNALLVLNPKDMKLLKYEFDPQKPGEFREVGAFDLSPHLKA